jgi:predicted RND superfamily exporter protein
MVGPIARLAEFITTRRRLIIGAMVVLTLLVGAGAANIEQTTEMEMFDDDPQEVEAQSTIQNNFSAHDTNTTELIVVVRNESGNVLSRESLLESLRYQQSLYQNETVNRTLLDSSATLGIENIVASQLHRRDVTQERASGRSPKALALETQITELEQASDERVRDVVRRLLDPERGQSRQSRIALDLLPQRYDPGSTSAVSRLTVVTHETESLVTSVPELSDEVRVAQETAATLADGTDRDEYRLSGYGLLLVEEEDSIRDSFQLVGPFAVLFVLLALAVAYRDFVDLLLGLVGIGLVLVWTFGIMGWLGIDFSIMMIAMPVLLIGLSIDYCIHVVMRYRETRADGGSGVSTQSAMADGLTALGPAFGLVTVTAIIGFLSIQTSGVPALSAFSIATASGIATALLVFCGFIPALKVSIERFLRSRGYDRTNRAFATSGRVRAALSRIAAFSTRRPVAILLLVLAVSSLGVAAGTQLDTQFSSDEYIAEDPPDVTQKLPGTLAPADYEVRETQQYLYDNFQSPDQRTHVLVEGNVTDPGTLNRVAAAERDARDRSVVFARPNGEPSVRGPVTAMRDVADADPAFAEVLNAADTTGDGIPDENLTAVYDSFFEAAPDRAQRLLYRADGEYRAVQIELVVDGTVAPAEAASEIRAVGDVASSSNAQITVTGDVIVNELVQRQLATTTVEGLAVALLAVFLVLVVAFRLLHSSAILGAVTLLPVLVALSWILGSMYLFDIPFSFATAIIGSIAIGLGVDYAIHMSERYRHELDERGDAARALEESVVGTGGALLGSAVTTAVGFGVLSFSLVPVLQQFGAIIALTLVFAFVASVLVLPSLLVLWTRYVAR